MCNRFAKYRFAKYHFPKYDFAKYRFAKYRFVSFRFAKYDKPSVEVLNFFLFVTLGNQNYE